MCVCVCVRRVEKIRADRENSVVNVVKFKVRSTFSDRLVPPTVDDKNTSNKIKNMKRNKGGPFHVDRAAAVAGSRGTSAECRGRVGEDDNKDGSTSDSEVRTIEKSLTLKCCR